MAYTEITRESWFSRLIKSFVGAILGVVLVLGSVYLLFVNEGWKISELKALSSGQAQVISVSAKTIDPANEGRLVHLTGRARAAAPVTDPLFGLTAAALLLERRVEMYQWEERRSETSRKNVGGSRTTVTRYTYHRAWSSRPIDSRSFREEGHDNPGPFPFESWSGAAAVTVGAFTLADSLVAKCGGREALPVSEEDLAADGPAGFRVAGGVLYRGADPAAPRIGDVRVRFLAWPEGPVTVAAAQRGDRLEAFPTAHGEIELLKRGTRTADELFARAREESKFKCWILRVVGFILMVIGVCLVFSPLVTYADFIPLFGDLLAGGVFLFALFFSLAGSLATIAVSWLVYQPLVGAPLLAIAALCLLALKRVGGRRGARPRRGRERRRRR